MCPAVAAMHTKSVMRRVLQAASSTNTSLEALLGSETSAGDVVYLLRALAAWEGQVSFTWLLRRWVVVPWLLT